MLLAEAGCVFMGLILYISGVQGRKNSICALKGSSMDLPCSAEHPTSNIKWYTEHWNRFNYVHKEVSADGHRVTYNMSEENHTTLTIKDVTESDAKFYCCRENTDKPELYWDNRIQLHVTDLQVKVIPTTEGQTVSLMCSTSCPLTENPAAYIWYKNREFLYQDWSPWYQQLVSSEEAVTYSCAIKGYKDLRAPEVSVDSVTSTCFSVTYAKGRMCSDKQTSVDEPCSITYPRELHVQKTHRETPVRLTCNTSCPQIDGQTSYTWYSDGNIELYSERQRLFVPTLFDKGHSCAVNNHKDLHSAQVCLDDKNCWRVNYVSRRICALLGSSVNISSEYLHPENQQPKSKCWYKIKRSVEEDAEELIKAAGRLAYRDNMNHMKNHTHHHILTINNLKKNDSAEYTFRLQQQNGEWKQPDFSGVTLVVSGLSVKFTPSAVVTEGQRVTLTCSTSCPLTDNTNYIWYLNSRLLTLPENQHKQLVLDPVSSQHAGRYSCAVKTGTKSVTASEKTLTVERTQTATAAGAAGAFAVLLVIIPLAVFLWIRQKRTSQQSPGRPDNTEELNPGPLYEDISAQPADQEELHYSRVNICNTQSSPIYSTISQRKDVTYAVVNFRSNTAPE